MFAASLLLAQAAVATDRGYPVSVFDGLCLRGEARFHQGAVRRVKLNALPADYRSALRSAALSFSDHSAAQRYGLQGSLPGFNDGDALISSDGNWAAIVAPKRPGGDQRCAVVARQIDRAALRNYGVVPASFLPRGGRTLNEMSKEGGFWPGVIVRISAFGKNGALVQAYTMRPDIAGKDYPKSHDAVAASQPAARNKER